jgi:hypothetical protein
MLQRTLLISETDLQDFASYSQYIEQKFTRPLIYDIQFREVAPVLCKELYSELIDAIASSTPLTPAQEILLYGDEVTFEGVRAWLAWAVYATWLREGQSKSTQSGLQRLASQLSEPPSDSEKNDVRQMAESRALFYKQSVIAFLNENKADYPNWCDTTCTTQNDYTLGKMTTVAGKSFSTKRK